MTTNNQMTDAVMKAMMEKQLHVRRMRDAQAYEFMHRLFSKQLNTESPNSGSMGADIVDARTKASLKTSYHPTRQKINRRLSMDDIRNK